MIPAELLMHLPYPCIYVKAPGLVEHVDGFFVWVDYDVNRGGPELRVQWMMDNMEHTMAQALHIGDGWTIHDCKKSEGVTCLPIFSPQLQEVQEDI